MQLSSMSSRAECLNLVDTASNVASDLWCASICQGSENAVEEPG